MIAIIHVGVDYSKDLIVGEWCMLQVENFQQDNGVLEYFRFSFPISWISQTDIDVDLFLIQQQKSFQAYYCSKTYVSHYRRR